LQPSSRGCCARHTSFIVKSTKTALGGAAFVFNPVQLNFE
jgi:hypothetical protein